jgi:hypothetical protein
MNRLASFLLFVALLSPSTRTHAALIGPTPVAVPGMPSRLGALLAAFQNPRSAAPGNSYSTPLSTVDRQAFSPAIPARSSP